MVFADRSKRRIHLWKKTTLIYIFVFFVLGFFAGFTPTITASFFPTMFSISYHQVTNLRTTESRESFQKTADFTTLSTPTNPRSIEQKPLPSPPRKLLILVTTTQSDDQFQEAFLTRIAHTLRLVPQPLLWIVVEAHYGAPNTAKMLRTTGIMYRHLTFKEDFTALDAETYHQRNVALNHIEKHRLQGIVHFAGMSNTYDLRYFEEIRDIKTFGMWPVATVSSNGEKVVVEGPICNSSKIVGWQDKDFTNGTASVSRASMINLSGLAFNSSILWDSERRLPDTSQDSIKFIQQVVLEDEDKLRPIPNDCSRIMTWHFDRAPLSPI